MLENETASPNSAEKEERALPDWAIAVIVIGLGSVAFVIIFGITVVREREKKDYFACKWEHVLGMEMGSFGSQLAFGEKE